MAFNQTIRKDIADQCREVRRECANFRVLRSSHVQQCWTHTHAANLEFGAKSNGPTSLKSCPCLAA